MACRTDCKRILALLHSAMLLGASMTSSGYGQCSCCTPGSPQGAPAAQIDGVSPEPVQDTIEPEISPEQFASLGGDTVSLADAASLPGYIDSAVIRSRIRTRYDGARGGDSDRAEFLYPAYNVGAIGTIQNGNFSGPNRFIIQDYDYDEYSTYIENAFTDNFSAFAEIAYRTTDILGADTQSGIFDRFETDGIGDMNAGFRYGLVNCPGDYLTFQFKVFIPTGDEEDALGTGHTSLMPGLLFQRQHSDRLTVFGEFHDWIGLDGTEVDDDGSEFAGESFTGNVLRYGIGAGYDLHRISCPCEEKRLTFLTEFVGWTVLDGLKTDAELASTTLGNQTAAVVEIQDASGDTIVNCKIGVRYQSNAHSIYAGYGFPLTNDDWYDQIVRLEYEYNVW